MAEHQGIAHEILRRYAALKGARSSHEQTWRDCYDHSFPARSQGFSGDGETISAVQTKQARLYDSTTTDSARILASGIQSGMTPANSRWFGMQVWDQTDGERRWLDDSAHRLWRAIHSSNFDADSFECNLDVVVAGWFVLMIEENKDQDGRPDGLRFIQYPISTCYLAASTASGQVDTLYRSYTLTAEQMVAEFGIDRVSDKVRDCYHDGKYDQRFNLLHAIYPRRISAVGARRAKNLPYASVHIECDGKAVLRESGYHERPFVAPRWTVIPNTVYATGPLFDALPDARTLNEICRMELAAADVAISGMWIAKDDGVLNPRTVKIGPRRVVVANDTDSMKPLTTGANFGISFTKREQLTAQIRKIMMADQLQPQDGPAMTATEVHVRVQLIRQLLGPVYGRLQAEYLQPLIERCFGLAMRAGLFDQPPESLADRPFTVVYLSPMAKSQKMEEVSAIESTFAAAAQLAAATGDPSVWDNFDRDEGVRMAADGRGIPAKLVRSADQVAELREAREQQQAAQQQQGMQQALAAEAASAGIQRAARAA
ncbi:portal protein [Bordetella avium]|uniref:portal protein n=1 Tax=Bordetella avium TaxID=521 RepID=UPI000E6A91E0|nr:portal protein [Bordetella avium]RIQ55328.1 phage tail protein [Bordetella avium]